MWNQETDIGVVPLRRQIHNLYYIVAFSHKILVLLSF